MPIAIARTVAAAAVFAAALPAAATTATVSGTLFDVSYDTTPFMFQTGEVYNGDLPGYEPVFQQYGGYAFVDADTIRHYLRPRDVVPNPSDPYSPTVTMGGYLAVQGGTPTYSDLVRNEHAFTIAPKAGQTLVSVTMQAGGWFDNSGTDAADLSYIEILKANGASNGFAATLGAFNLGPLPTGTAVSLGAGLTTPFDVSFIYVISGSSYDPAFLSSMGIDYIDFHVNTAAVPEPETYALMLGGLGIVGVLARRRRTMSS